MNFRSMQLLPLAIALAVAPMLAHGEDLLDAYHQALANDPVLAQQLAQRNITGQAVPLARAPLLPQLSASLSLQQSSGGRGATFVDGTGQPLPDADVGHSRSRNLSLNLSQSVLDFSQYASLDAAHAQVDSAHWQFQAALQDLIVRVTTAYFNALTAQDQVTFAKAYEKSLARQLDQAQQRFKVGLSAITDVQDAKAQHDSAMAQLIRARSQLADAREALSVITGQPAQNLQVLSDTLPMMPPVPSKLSIWVDHAKQENPTILSQEFNVEAAGHSIDAARDARLPTIDANLSYGKGATWYQNGPYRDISGNTTIGLTLSVPIFSGGAIHARVKRSIYQRDSAEAALTLQRRQVVRQTRNHFRSVLAGISEVEATRQAVVSSKSALDATKAGFQVGTRTIVDVLLAQRNLTNARQQYSAARHQFILDKLLLEQDAGSLTATDLKAVNALLVPPSSARATPMPVGPDDDATTTPAIVPRPVDQTATDTDAGNDHP